MPFQNRSFCDKTFDATGYNRVGFSIAHGPAGKDEERQKVPNIYVVYSSGSWLTPFVPRVFDAVCESERTFGTPSTLMKTTGI